MRRFINPVLFFLFFSVLSQGVAMAKEPPDVLLKRVTNDLIIALKKEDKTLQEKPKHIYVIIDKILVPYIDWNTMAKWVVGRQAWSRATKAEQKRFASEFKDLLIRTYASTLQAYNNQTIEYLPLRGGYKGKNRVQVASRIKEPGREPIGVSYRMVDKGSRWKVYDITIEGVSLLKGFQSQFADEVNQKGLEPLTQRLHKHNEKPLR